MAASAAWTATTASLREWPGARLKEMVVATDSSWWFTEIGDEAGPKVAMADRGTMISLTPLIATAAEAPRVGGATGPARVVCPAVPARAFCEATLMVDAAVDPPVLPDPVEVRPVAVEAVDVAAEVAPLFPVPAVPGAAPPVLVET